MATAPPGTVIAHLDAKLSSLSCWSLRVMPRLDWSRGSDFPRQMGGSHSVTSAQMLTSGLLGEWGRSLPGVELMLFQIDTGSGRPGKGFSTIRPSATTWGFPSLLGRG